ncbi:MAG: Brp/Blh family beta-carotene 15,15'-dioxygenase, partial [Candidatus Puniceispirillales bacterium]
FIGLYLLLAGVVIGFWILAPVSALGLFLLISLVHFGLGDTDLEETRPRITQMLAHGGIVTLAIPLGHREEVTALFTMISGPHPVLWSLIEVVAVISTLAGAFYAFLAVKDARLRRGFAEWLGLTVLVMLLPPLVGFALYFTLIHTPRHILRITAALRDRQPHLPVWGMTAGFTVATWAMAGIAFALLHDSVGVDAATLRIVFIGLAALTVPHMILIDGIFRPGLKAA